MRTRTIRETRKVPHTIDGRTVLVDEPYDVHVPVPPRDWDRTVRTGVVAVAGIIGAASIGWSTASIGALLDLVVITPAAYAAAAVFDLVWIACMALEWLARYDPARAALPRRAGYVALAIAMAAVGVHGHIEAQLVIGIVGATVSGLAKGLWTLVLAHHATPLDSRTQQWVDIQRAEAGGRLAMVAVRRELTRADALVEAEQAALRTTPDPSPETPEDEAETPDDAPELPGSGPMTIADAVRTAVSCGINEPDAVLRYVRKVADANAKEESVRRTLRMARRTA
ncbi:protein transporter Sec31 [Streptomyces sp. P9(2023)]|uniref:protein transporter Sec31 n=1 Tax=Streptomyces sp. P9(2023) TaxID=3064394 RepID=UPI0028F3F5FC|nr:protein transporter Sec31 [Streptomyces sp. P9(2023)]MDT9688177.1 protein transporter Sec31 [Streptomyces sp. P9(2023)]